MEDKFLMQVVKETTKRGVLLDLVWANREGVAGNLKAVGSLGCSDHEIVKEMKKVKQ